MLFARSLYRREFRGQQQFPRDEADFEKLEKLVVKIRQDLAPKSKVTRMGGCPASPSPSVRARPLSLCHSEATNSRHFFFARANGEHLNAHAFFMGNQVASSTRSTPPMIHRGA
jgi:hypothetical protein